MNGSFGKLVFGKNDSKFKKSEGKADLFIDYIADIVQLTTGQDRLKNIVGYQSLSSSRQFLHLLQAIRLRQATITQLGMISA